ncbi:MAG TPA: hypothetical protein VHE61_10110 [Opitutaceae bacterium]|nr:hypothetical protein [Opitutaceae bacterium]
MRGAPEVTLPLESFDAESPAASAKTVSTVRPERRRSAGIGGIVARVVRRVLTRNGLALTRLDAGQPEDLATYLAALRIRGCAIDRVFHFDSDPETLRLLASVFEATCIMSCSGPALAALAPAPSADVSSLLEVDARVIHDRAAIEEYLRVSSVVVLRTRCVDLWRGDVDVAGISTALRDRGFHLFDVLRRPVTTGYGAAGENVYLAFERGRADLTISPQRAYRVAEVLNQFSTPVARTSDLTQLGGRGAFGFAGGLYNPGAVSTTGGTILLARGEKSSWPVQKRSVRAFLDSARPTLLVLQENGEVARRCPVAVKTAPTLAGTRFEDFRLFEHEGRIYSNHSGIVCETDPAGIIQPEVLATAVNLSYFDPEPATLTHLGTLALDRPTERVEKNWAMFSAGGAVHLIYSFNPYRLFVASKFPSLHFQLAQEIPVELPLPDEGLMLRNSINPVPYDPAHLLHVVHKVYPGKKYVFWAVLIDRATLRPAKMTATPLLHRDSGNGASIVYLCSAVVGDEDVTFFGGLDDCAVGAWRISRARLDQQWTPVR